MVQQIRTPELKRGDVYYYTPPAAVGDEWMGTRPGVIVTSDYGLKTAPILTIVPIGSGEREMSVCPKLTSMPKLSYAHCNNITTISKARLQNKICTLTDAEMEKVDKAIALAMDLPQPNTLRISQLENTINQLKEQNAKLKLDTEIHKKSYEKLLDRVVEMTIEQDLMKRLSEPKPGEMILSVPEQQPEPEESGPVNINECTLAELLALGFHGSVAKNIIAARPIMKKEDLRIVPNVTRIAYQLVENKITVGDVSKYKPKPPVVIPEPESEPEPEPEKININTCVGPDLLTLGMGEPLVRSIMTYRKQNGKFTRIEELLNVPRFGRVCMQKYGPHLEV